MAALEDLLTSMSEEGFSKTDYNVMQNSCNRFTEVFDHWRLESKVLDNLCRPWQ